MLSRSFFVNHSLGGRASCRSLLIQKYVKYLSNIYEKQSTTTHSQLFHPRQTLQETSSAKYVGVTICCCMSWSECVVNAIKKLYDKILPETVLDCLREYVVCVQNTDYILMILFLFTFICSLIYLVHYFDIITFYF
ncbi:hypothetical protein CHS0354_014218 [Potamilus streckersoni]|uniref:Uncharacterized protein n=1 Tax=Potamilus streckersoni TaxID=2493646 RepID=A0AAE0SZ63_9BIVA|nr:hypothetical protein CHS0354_014218 [Potamilus streckersoni]